MPRQEEDQEDEQDYFEKPGGAEIWDVAGSGSEGEDQLSGPVHKSHKKLKLQNGRKEDLVVSKKICIICAAKSEDTTQPTEP
jgi:hypothetical protein